jgi:hypothetical protein
MNSFAFLFEAMKETHEHHKAKIDIDELISGSTNITLGAPIFGAANYYNGGANTKGWV